MFKRLVHTLMLIAASQALSAAAAESSTELGMRLAVHQAMWPGDIVQRANEYLKEHPCNVASDSVAALREKAGNSLQLLKRQDVQLFRSAFQDPDLNIAKAAELRQAALGDKDAAMRIAHLYQRPSIDDPKAATARYVGWLQFAASLGHDGASYELALFYREHNQPLLASQFEAKAVNQGFVPPPALDHVRK